MSESTAIIRAEGLTRRFGEFTAVDRLTIHVDPGSIFAFLGANGSGKSTTIRMLIGLLAPTEGTVEVDGIDVISHPRRVRDHIGYMGQKVSLYQGLSLRENVEFYAGLYGLSAADLEQRWGALRERLSLADAEGQKPEDLPAGVRQRAGLALSTLHQPRVLFLDEPTAGVDVHNRALFWELIQDEADEGVTIFVTTHFLEEADYCDRVCFIDAGRLTADGTPEELRRKFSDGYVVRLAAAEGASRETLTAMSALAGELGRGAQSAREAQAAATARFELRLEVLDDATLARLGDLERRHPEVQISVEQPRMTDVFRVLATQSEASQPSAAGAPDARERNAHASSAATSSAPRAGESA